MKFTIQMQIEEPGILPVTIPVHTIERSCEQIEDVGIRIAEAKAILGKLQDEFVRQQLAEFLQAHRACPSCQRPRSIKGYHPLRLRNRVR